MIIVPLLVVMKGRGCRKIGKKWPVSKGKKKRTFVRFFGFESSKAYWIS